MHPPRQTPLLPRRARRLLLLGACALFPALTLASDSLLPDGAFEQADAAGEWPAGWPKGGRGATWETEEGNRFLRLKSPEPGSHVKIFKEVMIPSGAAVLELSLRARVSDLVVGENKWYDARIIMNFKDATGKKTVAKEFPRFGSDTGGWVADVRQITVPPGSVSLEFMPSVFKARSGVFDLDDIVLKPLETTR